MHSVSPDSLAQPTRSFWERSYSATPHSVTCVPVFYWIDLLKVRHIAEVEVFHADTFLKDHSPIAGTQIWSISTCTLLFHFIFVLPKLWTYSSTSPIYSTFLNPNEYFQKEYVLPFQAKVFNERNGRKQTPHKCSVTVTVEKITFQRDLSIGLHTHIS